MNFKSIAFAVFSTYIAITPAGASLIDSGLANDASLVAYYPLDSLNESSLVPDASSNNRHGTISGNYAFNTSGSNSALRLDAGSYITLPTFSGTSLTASQWIKYESTSVNDWASTFSIGTDTPVIGANGFNFFVRPESQGSGVVARVVSEQQVKETRINVNLRDDSFHHIASTIDNGTMKTYFDGSLIDSQSIPIVEFDSEHSSLGRHFWGNGSFSASRFNGEFDDTAIFSRALSDAEIGNVFTAGYAPKSENLGQAEESISRSTVERGAEYFDPKVELSDLPLGELRIWNRSTEKWVSLSSEEGQGLFHPGIETHVMTHGWNGVGAVNTPLEEKWMTEYTHGGEVYHGLGAGIGIAGLNADHVAANVLAFDWTEAANSRIHQLFIMGAKEADITLDRWRNLISIISAKRSAAFGSDTLLSESEKVAWNIHLKWSRILDDRWVPNQQIVRQGYKLGHDIKKYVLDASTESVSFYGHSLGAGISTNAVHTLLALAQGDKVKKLTLYDPPEDSDLAAISGGRVFLEDDLARLKEIKPSLPIENFWSSNPLGYGKAYSSAANIETEYYGHSGVPGRFYMETAREEWGRQNVHAGNDRPENVGFGDQDGIYTIKREGTNCFVKKEIYSSYGGINDCIDGGEVVQGELITKYRPEFDFNAWLGSEYADVEFDIHTGLPKLTTGSPVFVYTDIFLTAGTFGLELDFEWLNWFDGDSFNVWLNDTLLFTLDSELALDSLMYTGLLDVSLWEGEWATLAIGVLSDHAGSSIRVQDIRLIGAPSLTQVHEPGSFVLIAIGLLGLGVSRGKMRNIV